MLTMFRTAASAMSDALLGRGEHAVTVPPMDGALQPNQALEQGRRVLQLSQVDNLTRAGDALYLSSQTVLYQLELARLELREVKRFDAEIVAIAAFPDRRLAVATDAGRINILAGQKTLQVIEVIGQYRCCCPTAMLAPSDDLLLVTEGSKRHRASQWRSDLMSRECSGSVWQLDLNKQRSECLGQRLAFPNGLARSRNGDLIVSESWKHRLLALKSRGDPAVLVGDLPGYPGRLAEGSDGRSWLAVFAPRNQLVEFILRERTYRRRMMEQVPEQYWVAPALSSGRDFREPLQGGAIKSMGILKPWAPTRSYGLAVELDGDFQPVSSLHSRSDGHRHGVTSIVQWADELLIASRGGNELVAVALHGGR